MDICLERPYTHHDFRAHSFNTFYLSLCFLDASFACPWGGVGGGVISWLVTCSNLLLLYKLDFDICPLLMSSDLGSVSIFSAFLYLPQHWLLMTVCTESKTPVLGTSSVLSTSPLLSPVYLTSKNAFQSWINLLRPITPLQCGVQPKSSKRNFEKPMKWRNLSRNLIK